MKKDNWKSVASLLIFHFWDLKLVPIDSALNSGKVRGDRALILTNLDNPMAEVFPTTACLFLIAAIFRGERVVKVGAKSKVWVRLFFMKT